MKKSFKIITLQKYKKNRENESLTFAISITRYCGFLI